MYPQNRKSGREEHLHMKITDGFSNVETTNSKNKYI